MNDDHKNNEAQESLDSSLESASGNQPDSSNKANSAPTPENKEGLRHRLARLAQQSSVYLPIFIIMIAVVAAITYIDYRHTSSNKPSISQQTLTPSALNRIANSNEVVGTSNQILTVQSSSIFNGPVLMRGDLQVAGKLEVGANLSLTSITVSSNSSLNQLSVAGNESVQGTLTVQKDLSVSGNGTFAGPLTALQITTNSLQLNGNLVLTHHISVGGPIPSKVTGGAVGSGGSSSISGSDSSGTVTFSTGNGPTAGCFVTVNFVSAYNSTPHMLITPVGASSATLSYYVNRNAYSFSLCSVNTPSAGQSYTYDYFVVD